MNKIRYTFATIALVVTLLSGLSLQGMGSMTNATSSQHVGSASSALVVGKTMGSDGVRPDGQCPGATTVDC